MANPFRMRRNRAQREFDFMRGEYVLPRKVRRWLERRLSPIGNLKVRLAAISLAQMIGRYHTGPKVAGREFFLCREALPRLFADEKGVVHSEWHLRCARDVLSRLGFIRRVTPVAEKRTLKTGRVGRWIKAVRNGDTFRAPKVMFALGDVVKSLFSEALLNPDRPTTRRTPVWRDSLFKDETPPPRRGLRVHSGEPVSGTHRDLERRQAMDKLRHLERRVRESMRSGKTMTFSMPESARVMLRRETSPCR